MKNKKFLVIAGALFVLLLIGGGGLIYAVVSQKVASTRQTQVVANQAPVAAPVPKEVTGDWSESSLSPITGGCQSEKVAKYIGASQPIVWLPSSWVRPNGDSYRCDPGGSGNWLDPKTGQNLGKIR